MIRNNEVMRKAAQRELDLLKELSAADPENKKHCVRLLDHFEVRFFPLPPPIRHRVVIAHVYAVCCCT